MTELPPIRNVMNINDIHVDATPKGYALRILRAYRKRCDETWVVDGLSGNEKFIYDYMNKCQQERAQELDMAITILEGTMQ